MAELTPRQVEIYVAGGGSRCPFCGDEGFIRTDDSETWSEGKIYVEFICNECGKEWTDIYGLIGIADSQGNEIIIEGDE